MSSGPPPVPGGRSSDEREAARRERAARRDDFVDVPPVAEPAGGSGPRWGRIIATGVLLALILAAAWFANSLFQPLKSERDGPAVRVSIPRGSTLGDIATILQDNGVISNAGLFGRARRRSPTRRARA